MGMYSYFGDEDIEVLDWNGLVEFFDFWDKYLEENYKDDNLEDYMSGEQMLNKKEKAISFESWSEIKLISYWYDFQLIFFELIAEYIEGRVEWDFENDDEAGNIGFNEGECEVSIGDMEWSYRKPTKMLDKKLPTEIKKRMMLKKLKNG